MGRDRVRRAIEFNGQAREQFLYATRELRLAGRGVLRFEELARSHVACVMFMVLEIAPVAGSNLPDSGGVGG